MIENLTQWISEIVNRYGSVGVFFISFLEEVIAPIPSTLTIMGAGFFLLSSYSSLGTVFLPALFLVAIPAALGMIVGGMFVYTLGYFGGKVVIDRWGRWFGLSWESVHRMERRFQAGYADDLVLVVLRIVPIFPNSLISGVCGLLRYPIRPFFVLSFLGGIPRALLMALLGWWAGSTYDVYAHRLSQLEDYVLVVVGVTCLLVITVLVNRKRKK